MPVRAVLFDVGDTLWHAAEAPPRRNSAGAPPSVPPPSSPPTA
ncbi:hypothetical protein O0235_01865 [Tepidiforma flava]|uniref:HAD family hydrolase n=1 Tax=Tepidiforma flava TaxID=3004094 RepID=A0ABY7M7S9_9CHLR|nr:hypothetical protein [Tepidiforma flava]WBL36347.1 hypothetical protein O0235_01865 [Tepidiforma flava]